MDIWIYKKNIKKDGNKHDKNKYTRFGNPGRTKMCMKQTNKMCMQSPKGAHTEVPIVSQKLLYDLSLPT
jgi:hypothetical protein